MSGRLVLITNIMAPELGRREAIVPAGMPIAAALRYAGWKLPPRTVLLNPRAAHFDILGKPSECLIHPNAYHVVAVNDDTPAVFLTWPYEGQKASQIAGIVASLALTFFAPQIGVFLLGSQLAQATVLGVSLARIAAGVILAGGNALISTFLQSPKPFAPPADTSPTYSLSAQSNQARLGAKKPELAGQHMIMCDLASAPWLDYVGNRQRVNQLLAVSFGDVQVDAIRAGQAVIWSGGAATGAYPEVEIEVIQPGGTVTLVHDNVFTSTEVSGQTILGSNEKDTGHVGPFKASKPGQYTNRYQVDLGVALFAQDDEGHITTATIEYQIEAQTIDNNGDATGLFYVVVDATGDDALKLARRDPQTITVEFTTDEADRHQFRMTRINKKKTDGKTTDVLQWNRLKAFLPAKTVYPDQTVIALRATGTVNLNGDALNKINVIATAKHKAWDGEAWSADDVPTQQIGALARYFVEQKLGAVCDLEALQSLQDTWTGRGDEFNGIFDNSASGNAWDDLKTVLRAGRAQPIHTGTRITFGRDEQKTVATVPFSPRNFWSDTFNIDFNYDNTSALDATVFSFIDRRTWSENRVLCALPGSTLTIDTAPVVPWKGITDRAHMWREGMFTIADGYYRRIGPKFRCDKVGRLCLPGNLVSIAHWLCDWGEAADVTGIALGATVGDVHQDILQLNQPWSRPDDADDDDANLIAIMTPDGYRYGPVAFELIDDGELSAGARIKLLDVAAVQGKYAGMQPRYWGDWSAGPLMLPRTDDDGNDYLVQCEAPRCDLGVGENVAQLALLRSMKPDSKSEQADVVTIIDDPRVHTADAGDPPDEVGGPESELGADLVIETIAIVESSVGGHPRVTFTLTGAPDASDFEFIWRPVGTRDYDQDDLVTGLANPFHFDFPSAQVVTVKIRAHGAAGYGPWREMSLKADGTADVNPADVTAITGVFPSSGTDDAITYGITAVSGAIGYLIQKEARVSGSGDFVEVGDLITIYGTTAFTYYAGDQIDDGGPFHNFRIKVKAFNNAGSSPDWFLSDDDT